MIIDFHTHIFPPSFRENRETFFPGETAFKGIYAPASAILAGKEELIRSMDQEGVRKAVVFGFPWEKEENFRRHNDYILDAVQQYPERLIGFCCVSPLSPKAAEEARRCLRAGLAGIGELAIYGSDLTNRDIEGLKDVMEAGREFDVPVLFHANEPVGHSYPGKAPITLAQLYRFIKTYPDNKIVLAHWGGGLVFFGLMKKEVGDVFKNTWFDTAASPYLYSKEIYRIALKTIGKDKILFGSDYPLLSPGRYLRELEELDIPPLAAQGIMGENAARLLKL